MSGDPGTVAKMHDSDELHWSEDIPVLDSMFMTVTPPRPDVVLTRLLTPEDINNVADAIVQQVTERLAESGHMVTKVTTPRKPGPRPRKAPPTRGADA